MAEDNLQQQIDEAINEKLRQEEEWEKQYGHLFMEKKLDKIKFAGGTLAGQSEKMKVNKDYARGKVKPKVIVKIKKK
ncbi:MAG: hypothetical protein V1684_02590 [bacterium]